MGLLDKIRDRVKELTDETASKTAAKEASAPEHGFLDAVKDEIGAPGDGEASPHDVTVEEVYQDLIRRKQKGEMPRIPTEALMDVLGKPPASEAYASAGVFELSRQYRDLFRKALQANDDRKLFDLFRATYALFIDQPETAGLTETMFNKKSEDTDPLKWEVNCASMPDGAGIALCCMPVKSKTLSARLIGIVISDSGDRYYSCMLNRDRNTSSEIRRSMGSLPAEKAGTISGTDPEPMGSFLHCIQEDRP